MSVSNKIFISGWAVLILAMGVVFFFGKSGFVIGFIGITISAVGFIGSVWEIVKDRKKMSKTSKIVAASKPGMIIGLSGVGLSFLSYVLDNYYQEVKIASVLFYLGFILILIAVSIHLYKYFTTNNN